MIVCAMASHPPRYNGMMRVIGDMLGQCDKFYVYLNGYDALPDNWPDDPKLVPVLAGPRSSMPDVGSHGKFHWIGRDPDAYYVTLDDDILYPSDYVAKMKEWCDKYERKAVVTLHGSVIRTPNGVISSQHHWWNIRRLYGYTEAIPEDIPVHQAGTAVTIMHPDTIGLDESFVGADRWSGDDEDLALWCQRNKVPIIRVRGQQNWVRPNNDVYKVQALHKNPKYLDEGDRKMKSWRHWTLYKPDQPRVMPRREDRQRASLTVSIPHGPCFDKIEPTAENIRFFNKILSSDAFAALVLCAIKSKQPLSAIRMADGERAILEYGKTGQVRDGFLLDQSWLTRYGLAGADLKKVAEDLKWAGENATYLACTISGSFWPAYNTEQFFPQRTRFIDQFFPKLWKATDRVAPILRAAPVLVMHRDHELLVGELKARYRVPHITGFRLSSWRDHDAAIAAAASSPAQTILVSGGPSGKALCVRLANQTGKVVLDIGEALGRTWCSILAES